MTAPAETILELQGVSRHFAHRPGTTEQMVGYFTGKPPRDQVVRAVDDVSLQVTKGQVVGIVGESGCGKSTLAKMVSGVLSPTSGRVKYRGRNVFTECDRRDRLSIQMVFQDPYASLNPRMTVSGIVGEAARLHGIVSAAELPDFIDRTLASVGLNGSMKTRYPHQFSGGQRQRIGIARALAVRPDLLVCDEAVSALDVSVQAQIINLFMQLREQLDMTYLFVSHDLAVVNYVSDVIVVMYLGRVVESGPATQLMSAPNHPYAQALINDVPKAGEKVRRFHPIRGEIPSPLDPPSGCHFHPRCEHAMPICRAAPPPLKRIAPNRWSACHLNDAVDRDDSANRPPTRARSRVGR